VLVAAYALIEIYVPIDGWVTTVPTPQLPRHPWMLLATSSMVVATVMAIAAVALGLRPAVTAKGIARSHSVVRL
jgi:hypothetical protein